MKSKTLTQRAFRPIGGSKLELNCNWGFNLKSLFALKKCAFTLAEVLITLGIIGVVAAMTLPTLIANYKNQVYVNKLKKMVSTIENGLRQASAEEGVAINQTDLFVDLTKAYCLSHGATCENKYAIIKKYFKVIGKDEEQYQKACTNTRGATCPIHVDGAISFMDGGTMDYDSGWQLGIDVNGKEKPNELGRDYFLLLIDKNGILHDVDDCDVDYYPDYRYLATSCGKCKNNSNDDACYFYRIQTNGWKMDY